MVLGIESKVTHKPYLEGERGAARLVYGVAHFKDGSHHFEWMSIQEVNKIRNRSKAKDNGPWVTDRDQMVRKTLLRRMANYLPMSIELATAVEVDNAAAMGNAATIDADFSVIVDEESNPVGLIDQETGEIKPDAFAETPPPAGQEAAGAQTEGEVGALYQDALKFAQKGSDLALDIARKLPPAMAKEIQAEYDNVRAPKPHGKK